MLNQKRITEEQVEWWIGSDHLSPSELINEVLIDGNRPSAPKFLRPPREPFFRLCERDVL